MAESKPSFKKSNKTATVKASKTTADSKFDMAKIVLWLHLIFITILFWSIHSTFTGGSLDLNGDNITYYLLGKRIATGLGFTNATSIHHEPHTHFPPAFPYLISFIITLFGDDMDNVVAVNGLLLYGSLLLFYFIAKGLTKSTGFAFAATVLVTLNAMIMRYSVTAMSEVPFIFSTLLGIFFLVKADKNEKGWKNIWLYLSVLFMVVAYYTKTTGVALIGAAVLYFAFSKKWKETAIVVSLAFLLMFPWYLRNKGLGNSYAGQMMQVNPYKPELGNLTLETFKERVKNNFKRYISVDIPMTVYCMDVTFETPPTSWWLMGLGVIALALFGIWRLKQLQLFLLAYFGATFFILLLWPDVWGGSRFILPMIPAVMICVYWGIIDGVQLIVKRLNFSVSPYFLLLFSFLFVRPLEAMPANLKTPMPANYVNYFEMAKWCKQNLPKDAIISARKPDMFILYSDLMTIGDKPSLDDKEVLDYFRKNGVDYVVIEQLGFSSTSKYLIPAVQKNQDKFTVALLLKDPDTYLLKFTEGNR